MAVWSRLISLPQLVVAFLVKDKAPYFNYLSLAVLNKQLISGSEIKESTEYFEYRFGQILNEFGIVNDTVYRHHRFLVKGR